jgi:hypothetical protein
MELDQFMKELAVDFIVFVIELFFPDLASRLDFAQKKDLNKQLYTASPEGAERFVDVLIEVPVNDPPPEYLLLHVESQQNKRFDFPARMLGYHCLIYAREIEGERKDKFSLPEFTAWQSKKRILSFVFCNYPIQGGITQEQCKVGLPESDLTCRYTCISLPVLSAREYLQKDNPVVCALSVFMDSDGLSTPELKVSCYRKLLDYLPTLTRQQVNIIVYALETYLSLSDSEEQVYQQMIREVYPEVNEMITNPLIERGRQEGIQLGRQEGVQQGKQSVLLQLLNAKFGALPEPLVQEIRAITSEQELDRLNLRVLTANSLDEMGLNGVEPFDYTTARGSGIEKQ